MSAGCFTCGAELGGEAAELLCWCRPECRDACPPGILKTLGRWRQRWNVEVLDGHGYPATTSALHDLAALLASECKDVASAAATLRLTTAVRAVASDGCWCPFGIGHPLLSRHDAACTELHAALAAATDTTPVEATRSET